MLLTFFCLISLCPLLLVLSVPSTPANPSLPSSLHRFPSSLLDPASFNRRITSLAKGEEPVEELYDSDDEYWNVKRNAPKRHVRLDDLSGEDDLEDEPPSAKSTSNRFGRVIKPTSRSGTAPRRSTATVSSSVTSNHNNSNSNSNSKPYTGERFKRWKMVDGKRIVWYIDSTGRTVYGQNPEQYAAAARKKAEADDNESSDCGSSDESPMEDSNSENDDNDEVANQSSDDDHQTRFGRRRSRLSTYSHLPSNGRRASSLPPIPPTSSSMTNTRSSANFIPMPMMPTPTKTINLSDLSPTVRMLSTKSGVAKMIESMADVFPSDCEDVDLDRRMGRVIAKWQEEDANLIKMDD